MTVILVIKGNKGTEYTAAKTPTLLIDVILKDGKGLQQEIRFPKVVSMPLHLSSTKIPN